jgi:molecular chaperone DnaK
MLVSEAREALQNEAPIVRVRELTDELSQVLNGLMAARSSAPPPSSGGSSATASDDDVIDADFDRV